MSNMSAEVYVKRVVKRVKCTRRYRKQLKQDLLGEVKAMLEQGMTMDDVISDMGSIEEAAGEFNENRSEQEIKRYRSEKLMCCLGGLAVVIVLVAAGIYSVMPRYSQIEDSEIFDEDRLYQQIETVISLLDEEDYDSLQELAIEDMRQVLQEDTMQTARQSVASDWGERKSTGRFYLTEVTRSGVHYAIGQGLVVYENVAITYTITFDEDMRLAGLYMK